MDSIVLFKNVIDAVGITGAAVYGVIWQECAENDGICDIPKLEIGRRLGLCHTTTLKYVRLLCEHGFVFDHHPFEVNRIHRLSLAKGTPHA